MSVTWIIKLYYPSILLFSSDWKNAVHKIITSPGLCNACILSNTVKNLHVISSGTAAPRNIFAFPQYLEIRDFKKLTICYISILEWLFQVYLDSDTTVAMALPKTHEVTLLEKHISNSTFCPPIIYYLWGQLCARWTIPPHHSRSQFYVNFECMPYKFHIKEYNIKYIWYICVYIYLMRALHLYQEEICNGLSYLRTSFHSWGSLQFKSNNAHIELSSYTYVAILKMMETG